MHKHHSFDYIELKVSSVSAAKEFYQQAFGFGFNDYGPDYAGMVGEGGNEVAGLALSATVTRGGPLVVLYSKDLEETRQAIRKAGGTICVEVFDFPGGRRFHFQDPSGNELAVWSDL